MDPVLLEVAQSQRWVITRRELLGAGLTRSAIDRRVRNGPLLSLYAGVYLVGRTAPTEEELLQAALKACGRGSVLAFRTAAQRRRIIKERGAATEIIVSTNRRAPVPRHPMARTVTVYRRTLHDDDWSLRGGLRTTSVAATLLDLARVLSEPELRRAVHEAEYRQLLDLRRIDAQLERRPRAYGRANLVAALRSHRPIDGRLDSTLEHRFHRFLADRHYPPTEHNVRFALDDGEEVAIDVLFRSAWLAVEVDGGPHRTQQNFHRDRRRDRRLDAEWQLPVLRVTEQDLDAPEELDADLWKALTRRDPTLRRGYVS